jgi:hypothetical protein
MTRLMIAITLLFVPLFTVLMVAVRTQPPNMLPQEEIGNCSTPCWQGIQPGITSKQIALTRLTIAHGYDPIRPVCYSPSMTPCELYHWVSPENVHIWTGLQTQHDLVVSLEAKTPGFTLGDALLSLDDLHHDLYAFQIGHNLDWLYLWLSFSDASISVSAQATCPTSFFAMLQTPIDTVTVQSPSVGRSHEPMTFGQMRQMFYDLCEK